MANEEHLQKLQVGPVSWNRWRADNPEVKPDLSGINLARIYLRQANLAGADLTGAPISQEPSSQEPTSRGPVGS